MRRPWHYTLTAADLALIARQRLDQTRLGFALMLCALRYPGRLLREGGRPPAASIRFVAEQVGVFPEAFQDYLRRDQTRRRDAPELHQLFRYRLYASHHEEELAAWLLPT